MLGRMIIGLAAAVVLAVPGSPPPARSAGGAALRAYADFNGDGYADLAIGVPQEDVGSIKDAGAIHVLYGSEAGLVAADSQFLHQDSPGLKDTAEAGDQFGRALAAADFNGDGFADLAVGVPLEDVGTVKDAGALHVLYGSASGLTGGNDKLFTQDSPGMKDAAEEGDRFGQRLVAGDFNGDGYADLAIAVTLEDVGTIPDAGAVAILYGSPAGLTAAGNQFWHQDSRGIEGKAEPFDRWAMRLTSGDFNGDGYADLAIGGAQDDIGEIKDAGAVNVLYGSVAGLTAEGNQFWHQDSPGIKETAEAGDHFGWALAAGDFNGDGYDDLGVGVLFEGLGTIPRAGGFHAIYGSPAGLTDAGNQFWHQDSPGIKDDAEPHDQLGWFLSSGDFNGDGFADLAAAARKEDVGEVVDAGAVNVLYGSSQGLRAAGNQFWHQDSPGIEDMAEKNDRLGWTLTSGNFNADGFADLVIAVVLEGIGRADKAGTVHVLYGTAGGLSASGSQFWHQDSPGIPDAAERGDHLGRSLSGGE